MIYTQCISHLLNLVIGDSTAACSTTENSFGLVEQNAVFSFYYWVLLNDPQFIPMK